MKTATPPEDPSEASTDITPHPSHEKFARNNLPGFFSALGRNLVSNFHSHLITFPSFSHLGLHPREWRPLIPSISSLAQIPKSLTHHAMKTPSVIKRYCVSGYTFLTDSVKSAMARALGEWNMRMDRIAAANGWADSLPSSYPLTPPPHMPSSVPSSPETGLLSIRQTDLALREEYSLCAHVGRTVQRTTMLASWIVLREVRKWEVAVKAVGKAVMWDVAQLGRRVWGWLVILSVVWMAFPTVLVLLGLVWGLKLWFQAAAWLLRRIRG